MFNAVSRSFISLCRSICGNSPPFGIDPSLGANEKELHFLGWGAEGPVPAWAGVLIMDPCTTS